MTRPPCLPSGARPGISRGLAALIFGTLYGVVIGAALATLAWRFWLCACGS